MATLEQLPCELLDYVAGYLSNGDRKSLRLASPTLGQNVLLRINRVFIGANPLNVRVFREIADSEVYRHHVREVIWDDAHLTHPPAASSSLCPKHQRREIAHHYESWFSRWCSKNRVDWLWDDGKWQDQPHIVARKQWAKAEPPSHEMWKYYVGLLSEQSEVMKTSDDAKALEYGLQRFTSLEKITLTPATHGIPFTPYYKTPMIRAFPYGYNYPIPRGWLASEPRGRLKPPKWDQNSEKNRWRGYRIITWMLAHREHNVKEFVVDVALLNTGLDSHMFDEACTETDDLSVLLSSPAFRRLDLALIVGDGQYESGYPAFRSQSFRSALEQARDLEHFSLRTNIEYEDGSEDWARAGNDAFVPLKTVFPVECWSKLRHFGLSSFIVRLEDVMDFLASLPDTIREVELSFLRFQEGYGSHMELLIAIKWRLGWQRRREGQRPRLRMARHDLGVLPFTGEAIWMDDEVNEYVYGDGENPFGDQVLQGVVTGDGFIRNVFQPANDRPNLDVEGLMKAGYMRPSKGAWPSAFTTDGTFVPPEGWKRAVDVYKGD